MPKIVDHEAYKKQIVQDCFELMATRGYYALSMRDLSRSLRISTGTLYYYFTNKLGLFEAILQQYSSGAINDKMKSDLPSASFEDGLEKLFASLEAQEKLWAKVMFIQVDAYREPDGKLLSIFNNAFATESTRIYLSKLLHINDPDAIDMVRALTLGIIIQRVLSRKKITWSAQKELLKKVLLPYAGQLP